MMTSTLKVVSVLVAVACVGCMTGGRPTTEDRPTRVEKDAGGKPVEVPPGSDMAKIQGHWEITSIELLGKVVKPGGWSLWSLLMRSAFSSTMFFKADRTGTVGYSNLRFELDETRDPKQITMYDDDGTATFRGIYALDGDTLTMCLNGDGKGVCRPEAFVTKKGTPITIYHLKRVVSITGHGIK